MYSHSQCFFIICRWVSHKNRVWYVQCTVCTCNVTLHLVAKLYGKVWWYFLVRQRSLFVMYIVHVLVHVDQCNIMWEKVFDLRWGLLCLQKLFRHWWCFDCASIMMVHITGYEVFSRGGGVNGGRSIYRNWGRAWCSFLYQLHVCVVCVLGLGWVDISKTSNRIVYSWFNATEIDYICWFQLQLTLLLMNSISSPACRRSPAISFFSCFSIYMLSVFLFVIKLTSPQWYPRHQNPCWKS